MRVVDGIGLLFLKLLSFSIFLGSIVIFIVRIWSEYGQLDYLTARAIAIVNPLILVSVALYLNYLFHQKVVDKIIEVDSQNIKEIKKDTSETNKNVKKIKNKIIK